MTFTSPWLDYKSPTQGDVIYHMRLFHRLPFYDEDITIDRYFLNSIDLSAWPANLDIDVGFSLGNGEMEATLIAHNVAAPRNELLADFELIFR